MTVGAVAAALGAAALLGCGSSGSAAAPATTAAATGAGSSPPATAAAARRTVTIDDFDYRPRRITVAVGTKLTWVNDDIANHTATSDRAGRFDTGNLPADGARKAITFRRAGTFAYHCAYHPTMHGTVVVRR